jgi:hypothetical protein
MKINIGNIGISFGYKSVLKTYWREGKLPTVKKDIYGKEIINETVEHIIPKSKGGKSNLFNYAIANAEDNFKRGSDDIMEHTTIDNVYNWFKQFVNVKLPHLDGQEYIRITAKKFGKVGYKVLEMLKNEGLIK